MKGTVVISGSLKLTDEINYWIARFEEKGYEVINYPHIDKEMSYEEAYKKYFEDIKRCDIFFLMNARKGHIDGYVGPSVFSELTYAVMNNLVEEKKTKILMLDMPNKVLFCFEEIIKWLNLGWIEFLNTREI